VNNAVVRDMWSGRVVGAHACRIVEEREDLIALWIPAGAPQRLPADKDGALLRTVQDEWALVPSAWARSGLMVARPGAAHSIWIFFDTPGWYLNLEEPLRRTRIGFDRLDQKLDVLIEPNGSWRWKDEDELEEAAQLGIVDAAAVRAEAARVLADPPWPTGWEDWRPDPAWPMPQLPEGWDRVE
jgi:hypothetical protein